MNLYGFAGGDPVNFSDPFGLCPENLSLTKAYFCNLLEAGMTGAGAAAGFIGGGGAGFLTGPGAIIAAPAGAIAESAVGAGAGLVAGRAITNVLFAKKGDIQQVEDAARRNKMTPEQRREFGDFLESEKGAGRGGTKNDRGDYKWKEMMEKAKEFLGSW